MENKNNNKIPFITCPKCSGRGDLFCQECRGAGNGGFFSGKFLYWGMILSSANIFRRHGIIFIRWIFDFIMAIFCLFGVASMTAWAWFYLKNQEFSSLLNFWQEKNALLFIFWISCPAIMLLIYRSNQRQNENKKIKPLNKNLQGTFPDSWNDLKRWNGAIDISSAFREKTLALLEKAYFLAKKKKQPEITPLHLLAALLSSDKIAVLFTRLDVPSRELVKKINNCLNKIPATGKKNQEINLSPEVKEILINGYIQAVEAKQDNVNSLNLLFPCFVKSEIIKEILSDFKIDENKIKNTIEWFRISQRQTENYRRYRRLARFKPSTNMDRAYTAVATPLLNSFGYDLTLAAKWGRLGLCVAREKEIATIFEVMKSGATGILLTGPEGSGKRTIIEGLAAEMVSEEKVPDFLKDKRLIELDTARLISGASPSEAEGRLLTIIDEIRRAGNIILFLENLENIIGLTAGQEESLELSEVLSGELERGALRCLATASEANYLKYVEGKAIGNIMSRVKIEEPEGDQAIHILESKVGNLEARHKIFFSYNALEAARDLSAKYIHDKYLPAKAIEILEKTASRTAGENKSRHYICTRNDIALTIKEVTNIPAQEIEEDEGKKLLNLEEELHKYVIGQEEAVKMTADSLRRARTSLKSDKRPIASFLFLGPTGVGKTELAKTIAKVYFEKSDFLIRLDMSEYQHEDSIIKIIGEPNGTSGYLTDAVRHKPFSLILLDEFEKANPKIFNLFLQVMDDGRLTDGQGRTVDFTNSIIIATSNASSEFIQTEVERGTPIEKIKEELLNKYLNKILRPELINRFDGIVVFKPLSEDEIAQIARLMLKDFEKMLTEKGITLEISEAGVRELAHQGYDPKFGARPLRRLIQEKIENEAAKLILGKELKRRDVLIINKEIGLEIRTGQTI
jgi:ATP-dependent Clp protease ATP-binding subunit ClpC